MEASWSKPVVSLIIPTYNEADVCKRLDHLACYLKEHSYEIIIVDDSNEECFALLDKYCAETAKFTLIRGSKKGKGAAIRLAAGYATGDITFYIDSDLTIPLSNIEKFITKIRDEDYDVVMAERPLNRGFRSFYRYFLSAILYVLVRVFVFNSNFYHDTQCGFKAFKTPFFKRMLENQRIKSGMFDVEYLYMALINKAKIFKITVSCLPETRPSRIHFLKCIWYDPVSLLKIKINGMLGRYDFKSG